MTARKKAKAAFWKLYNLAGICGMLLLARPLIYLLFSRRRDLNSYSAVDASAMIFILYAVACFFFAFRELNLKYKSELGRNVLIHSPMLWFILYTLYGIASMIWSVNPMLTGFRAFECLAMLMLIVATIQRLFRLGSWELIMRWSMLYCTWDILLSLGRTLSWTTNPSNLLESSQMCATTFFFIALYCTPKRWYNYLIIVMSVFSMSTVAYLGMAAGCIGAFWSRTNLKIYAFFGACLLAILTLGVGPYALLKNTLFFDKKDISLEQTTGRDHLMEASIESLEQNPMGLGFFAAEPYVLYAKNLGAISAHNSFFSAALGLGLPGVAILLLFFLAMGRCVFGRYMPPRHKAALIGCFFVGMMHSMGNPGIGSRVYGSWMPVLFVFSLICTCHVYGKYYKTNL